MDMKHHILAALREEFDRWEDLLVRLDERQILTPLLPSHWTVKDVIAHLMAWQQRSVARVDAAVGRHDPRFPDWSAGIDLDAEGVTDRVNARIYETYRDQSWSAIHSQWQAGFERFLRLSEQVSEPDLLASGLYPWLEGSPLALILTASYDHHQEHLDKLNAWLREHGEEGILQ